MPNKLIRSLGATAILAALGVGAVVQVWGNDPAAEVDIVAGTEAPNPPPTGPPSTEPATDTPPVEPVAEEPDFVYRVGTLGAPSTDNFWEYFGTSPTVWDAYVLAPTKGSLFLLDTKTQTLIPDLADELPTPTWDETGWHVVVRLRGDNRWSDGRPLTAHDFAFTFDTVRALGLGGQWADVFPASVASVTAADDYHLEIAFSSRPGLEVWPYAVGTAPVMAAHYWEGVGATAAAELFESTGGDDPSSGPMTLGEVSPDLIVSTANPGYRGRPGPGTVEYRVYPEVEDLTAALANGEIHAMLSPRGLTGAEAADMDETPGVTVTASPLHGVRYLAFNLERAPMDRLAFRGAVAALIDRETLADEVAHAPVSATLLPPSSGTWYDPDRAGEIAARAPDFAEAIEGLKAAGYSWETEPTVGEAGPVAGKGLRIDGQQPAPLTILTAGDAYDPARGSYAERVAEAIELLGFEVIPVTTDFDTVIDLTFNRDDDGNLGYDMALLGWTLGNPGLPSFYGELLGSTSSANNTGYSSKEMDRLLARYQSAPDLATARDLVWEIEALLADDIPYLPLYASTVVEAYRSDLVIFADAPGVGGIQGTMGAIQTVSPVP